MSKSLGPSSTRWSSVYKTVPCRSTHRLRLSVASARASPSAECSRREVSFWTAAALSFGATAPAYALFGIGGGRAKEYDSETGDLLGSIRQVVTLPKDDPEREDQTSKVRLLTNKWVAKYRRDSNFAGRPSYSNTYSVVNALQGHFNSFGTDAPIPKKRLERMMKELTDAERFLSRGR